MNTQEAAKLLALMRTVWEDRTGIDAGVQAMAYQMAMSNVSYADAEAAFTAAVRELTFFPKPAELLERLPAVRALRHQSSPAADLRYILSDVIGNAVALGLYDGPSGRIEKPATWPNPIMAEAVRLFGWSRLIHTDPEWLPKEWEKVWNLARETVTRQYLAGEIMLDAHGMLPATVAGPEPLPEVAALAEAKTMAVS